MQISYAESNCAIMSPNYMRFIKSNSLSQILIMEKFLIMSLWSTEIILVIIQYYSCKKKKVFLGIKVEIMSSLLT